MPTFGSLFAGIGGIDLGLERAGWTGRWQVEWDPYCQHVLAHHWPDVPRYGDITAVDWSTVEPVDLIAGGFPCQPFSVAGKQRRLDDERWLWPEFARAVRALRPRYVLVENVPGLLAGGGMGAVLGELAELGYDAFWDSIPAAAVGAPHLRYRVWIVAYRAELRWALADANNGRPFNPFRAGWDAAGHGRSPLADAASGGPRRGWGGPDQEPVRLGADVADAAGGRQPGPGEPIHAVDPATGSLGQATQPLDGRPSDQWRVEPNVGRVAHGVPARVDRLRALGNAVVPQVVEVIGRRLLALAEGPEVAA